MTTSLLVRHLSLNSIEILNVPTAGSRAEEVALLQDCDGPLESNASWSCLKNKQVLYIDTLKNYEKPGMVVPAFNPALRKERHVGLYEFSACLVYTMSSRPSSSA